MEKNQILPGIVAFKYDNSIRYNERTSYEFWVKDYLEAKAEIWIIGQDGKQWSVGDETNYGPISSFEYTNGEWYIRVVNNYTYKAINMIAVKSTKPPQPNRNGPVMRR